ncbi:MAG: gamma-glutamyltransferase, partial [Anaerolineae bacterium]|nr:gamma-glutamyltransferase [Anaerolineae bacterium]
AAMDAPMVYSAHFPSSFYPRSMYPARVMAEGRIPSEVLSELEGRGHEVIAEDGWSYGRVAGIAIDCDRGVIKGAASPRKQIAYAMGW